MSYNKPTVKEKIAYALGDAAAGGITWKIMSIAFPLFFTNVFGLTFADAAALMLIARLFDVVTDPIMGSLADRTQSRWGTYRPWLIFGAIPFGLIFALLLYTPDLGPSGKRVYAYVLYLLMMAVYTAVNVPYGSLLGVNTMTWYVWAWACTASTRLTTSRWRPYVPSRPPYCRFASWKRVRPWVTAVRAR